MDLKLNLAGMVGDSIVDGPGLRFAIFAQGCPLACPGCHNPQTHAFGVGTDYGIDQLVDRIRSNPLVRGVTFSGGEPFCQAGAFSALASRLKAFGYELASYTGFTWEALVAEGDPDRKALLQNLDVLIDGPFILARRDLELRFRGSGNQRIIDVPASLQSLQAKPEDLPPPTLVAAKRWAG